MPALRSRRSVFAALLLPGALLAQAAAPGGSDTVTPARQSATLTYGADIGLGESDNVTLSHSNKVTQTIALADFDFDVKKETRRFDFAARGNFTDLDYLEQIGRASCRERVCVPV